MRRGPYGAPRVAHCSVCGLCIPRADVVRKRARCEVHRYGRTDANALVDWTTRFPDDPWAVEIARRGGCTLEIVGDAMGLTRERIRQIEESALRKLVPRLALVGVDATDIARILATRPGQETGYVPEPGWRAASYAGRTPKEARAAVHAVDDSPSECVRRVDAAIEALEIAAARAWLAGGGEV